MLRYVATAAIAALLLGVALKAQGAGDGTPVPAEVLVVEQPEVHIVRVPGGHDLTVRHRFAGSLSRASLVYEDSQGEPHTVAQQTNCQKSLDASAGVGDDGYATEVELTGRIPSNAAHVRLVLEDETGTRVLPVAYE